jgi:xylose isomerase
VMLETTRRLGGENYVLWGGREGYDTLLNTDLAREQAQFARFLTLVAEHKHRIGFKGMLLIEPKPMEPTKHQYDYDAATVHGFLVRNGLEKEYRVNLEVNHATLAGHSFHHEIATAIALGIFGSVDVNRGDYQNGWDTDQFPNSVEELSLALYEILRAGGFTSGGFNFDTKLRRQSVERDDLFHAHIGGMDTLARALLVAADMLERRTLDRFRDERYAGWSDGLGAEILGGRISLADLETRVSEQDLDPHPRSGRQELLENLVNERIWAVDGQDGRSESEGRIKSGASPEKMREPSPTAR